MNALELWVRALTVRSRSLTRRVSSCLGLRTRLESGASAVEYGLLIAGIAAIIVTAVFIFGGGASGLFHGSCSTILEETNAGSCS